LKNPTAVPVMVNVPFWTLASALPVVYSRQLPVNPPRSLISGVDGTKPVELQAGL